MVFVYLVWGYRLVSWVSPGLITFVNLFTSAITSIFRCHSLVVFCVVPCFSPNPSTCMIIIFWISWCTNKQSIVKEKFWKAIRRNSISSSSKFSYILIFGRRLVTHLCSWSVNCMRSREVSEAETEIMKTAFSLADTTFTTMSVFVYQIHFVLKVLLLLFSVSASSPVHLNNTRMSGQLIFVFQVFCQ